MTTLTPDQVLERLNWRYATKQFDASKKIADDNWQVLEQALVLSPSSFGLQPWKFVIVEDRDLREQLKAASWNQSQVTDADRYVVFAAQRSMNTDDVDRLIQRTSDVRGVPADALSGYRDVIVNFISNGWAAKDLLAWNSRQTYIALGQFMTAAATLGIDTCPMEGIDVSAYDKLLGLEGTQFATLCACAAGYRGADDKYATAPKVRYAADEVIERR